jgi:hypothetical protein
VLYQQVRPPFWRRRKAHAIRDAGLFGRYPPVQPGWFPDPQNRCQIRYFDGAMWTGHAVPR